MWSSKPWHSCSHPWSLRMAPITPSTSGQPGPRLSPWLWRICKTLSSCFWRMSACSTLDNSFKGLSNRSCRRWKKNNKEKSELQIELWLLVEQWQTEQIHKKQLAIQKKRLRCQRRFLCMSFFYSCELISIASTKQAQFSNWISKLWVNSN